jgi:hypothetical protein
MVNYGLIVTRFEKYLDIFWIVVPTFRGNLWIPRE